VSSRNILDNFCIAFCDIVSKHTPYIIVSGFVAISLGRTRATEDIDMILPKIPKQTFLELHQDLITNGFVCVQSDNPNNIYDDYLIEHSSIRYTYENQPLPEMEIKLSKDELDDYQLRTKTKLPLSGLDIWFSNINVNIAFKEHLLKSEKDLKDAEHLRKVHPELINKEEIIRVKKLIDRCRR
jgi:hypothetical protein